MIIAIDPGTYHSAVVVYERFTKRVDYASAQTSNPSVLEYVRGRRASCTIVCEWIESQGMVVGKETFQTVYWIGRFAEACKLKLIPRRAVKLHLCGSARAKDPNIRQALLDRLGPTGTKKDPGPCYGVSSHAWQALALALTYADLGDTCCVTFAD